MAQSPKVFPKELELGSSKKASRGKALSTLPELCLLPLRCPRITSVLAYDFITLKPLSLAHAGYKSSILGWSFCGDKIV